MRLTKLMKSAFVRAVLGEIPAADYDALAKEAQAEIVAAMSEPVRALYETHPNALRSDTSYGFEPRGYRTFVTGDADFEKVLAPYEEKTQALQDIKRKLQDAVESCSTTNQLACLFPEFAHHVPSETKPVPGVPALNNVVADLVKLGWTPRVVR